MNSPTAPAAAAPETAFAEWRDYFALLKPRVMTLVVFTAACAMIAAPGSIHPFLGFTAILCIAVAAGAAGALNQWYEADIDALMKRTANRPLPAGKMTPFDALSLCHRAVGRFGRHHRSGGQLGRGLLAGGLDPVLCRRLHRLAEAPDAAEHRHRRCGRRVPGHRRLGRRYR